MAHLKMTYYIDENVNVLLTLFYSTAYFDTKRSILLLQKYRSLFSILEFKFYTDILELRRSNCAVFSRFARIFGHKYRQSNADLMDKNIPRSLMCLLLHELKIVRRRSVNNRVYTRRRTSALQPN